MKKLVIGVAAMLVVAALALAGLAIITRSDAEHIEHQTARIENDTAALTAQQAKVERDLEALTTKNDAVSARLAEARDDGTAITAGLTRLIIDQQSLVTMINGSLDHMILTTAERAQLQSQLTRVRDAENMLGQKLATLQSLPKRLDAVAK